MSANIARFLADTPKLPSAPAVASQILDAVRSETDAGAALARIIATDPALTARLLSVANSPIYAAAKQITRVEAAIQVVGLNALKNLALSFLVTRALMPRPGQGFDLNSHLARGLTAAIGAELAAKRLGFREDIFACALLQDVGMLVYALRDGQGYGHLLREAQLEREPLWALERKHYGFDHQALGAEVLRRWGLPKVITEPIAFHHGAEPAPSEYAPAAELLQIGDKAGDLYHGYRSGQRLAEMKALLSGRHGMAEAAVEELVDAVAQKATSVFASFEVSAAAIKPYSQLLQETNEELSRLNLSYEQLVMDLKQSQAKVEQLADELRAANAALSEMVSRDGLTGLYNHRTFQELLRKEAAKAIRHKRPLALVMFDIDHFKRVNDSFGHPAGDAVIRLVAQLTNESVRESDLAARYGGEEFALILPETDMRGAAVMAERLRRKIESTPARYGEQELRVTVSLGLCAADADDDGTRSVGELIEIADRALYAAKRAGRNRLVVGGRAAAAHA
jgi:diguanylate cyclase (GGDEF)-like protein